MANFVILYLRCLRSQKMSKCKKFEHYVFLSLIFPAISFAADFKLDSSISIKSNSDSVELTASGRIKNNEMTIPPITNLNTNATSINQLKIYKPNVQPPKNLTSIGTESGGGGTTVEFKNRRVLLDLLRIPSFTVDQDNSNLILKTLKEKTIYLNYSEISLSANIKNELTFQLAMNILEKWQDPLMPMFPIPLSITKPLIHWQLTVDQLVGSPATYDSTSNPRLSAYYYRHFNYTNKNERHYQVSININEWNKLGILSQAGLIIHETLRHQQFLNADEKTVAVFYQDEQLQKASAILLLCRPRPALKHIS